MAKTNIQLFNGSLNNALTDSEYTNSEDRINGVLGQLAKSNVHNKLFAQVSSVAYAVAQFIVQGGYNAMDSNPDGMTINLKQVILDIINERISDRVPNTRVNSTLYQRGDIVDSPYIPLWGELECIESGESADSDVLKDITIKAIGQQINDGYCVWAIRPKRFKSLLNVPVPFSGEWTSPTLIGEPSYPIHPEIGLAMIDYRLCDGTNGTIDMRGRVLRGKQSTSEEDSSGGVDSINISKSNLPTDIFQANDTTVKITMSGTTGGQSVDHTHTIPGVSVMVQAGASYGVQAIAGQHPLTTGGASGNHVHGVSLTGATTIAPKIQLNNVQTALSIIPKNYSLSYIQRIY